MPISGWYNRDLMAKHRSNLILWLGIAALLVGAVILFSRALEAIPASTSANQFGSNTYQAEVVEIIEEGQIDLGGIIQPYQVFRVNVSEGPFAGTKFDVDYGKRQIRAATAPIRVGERLLIMISEGPGVPPQAYFVDFIRTQPLLWLLGTFVVVSIVISGWKGVRSLLAMGLSLTVIIAYILPHILQGDDPVLVSVTGAFMILATTLYLVYGWTLKTHSAVLGTLTALMLTGLLAVLFVDVTRLTGYGSEDALFLSQLSGTPINLRGLILGGIIIGSLGVLDDLVITQASAVFELYAANPAAGLRSLFRQAMRIGQDHVAATVNTLVLAYAGAALPLLLLVSLAGEQWVNFLNREFVVEEVVRTLVGSLGLMAAVPLTTALACVVVVYQERFGRLRPFLGPATSGDSHHHH